MMDQIVNSRAERSHLLNLLMQLRKVAGHPYLFEGVEDRSLDPMGEHVITVEKTADCNLELRENGTTGQTIEAIEGEGISRFVV